MADIAGDGTVVLAEGSSGLWAMEVLVGAVVIAGGVVAAGTVGTGVVGTYTETDPADAIRRVHTPDRTDAPRPRVLVHSVPSGGTQ